MEQKNTSVTPNRLHSTTPISYVTEIPQPPISDSHNMGNSYVASPLPSNIEFASELASQLPQAQNITPINEMRRSQSHPEIKPAQSDKADKKQSNLDPTVSLLDLEKGTSERQKKRSNVKKPIKLEQLQKMEMQLATPTGQGTGAGLIDPIYTMESISPEGFPLGEQELAQTKKKGMMKKFSTGLIEGPKIVSSPPSKEGNRPVEVPYLPIAYRFYRKLKLKHIYKSLTNDIAKHLSRPVRQHNPAVVNKQQQKKNWQSFLAQQGHLMASLPGLLERFPLNRSLSPKRNGTNNILEERHGSFRNIPVRMSRNNSVATSHPAQKGELSPTKIVYFSPLNINSTSESSESAFKEILRHFKRAMADVQEEQLSKTGNLTITKQQQEEAAQKVLRETIMSALTGAGQTSQDQVTFEEPHLQEEASSNDRNSLMIKQPIEIEQHFRKNATPLSIVSDARNMRGQNLSSFSKQPGSRTVFSRKSSNKIGELIRRENSRQDSHPPTSGNTRDSITSFKGQIRNNGNIPFRQSMKKPLPPRFPDEPHKIIEETKRRKSTIPKPSLVTLKTQEIAEKGIRSKKEVKREIVYKPLSSTTPRDQKKAGVSTRIPVASKLIRHPVSTNRSHAITEEEETQRELALQTTRYQKNGRSPRPGRDSIDTSLFTSDVNYTTNDGFYSRTPGLTPFMTTQRLNAQSRVARGMNDTTETLTRHLEELKKMEVEAQTPQQHIPAKSFISPIIIEEAEKRGDQQAEKQITGHSADQSQEIDPEIQLISDIYDHFVVHQSPLKPLKNLFRQNYKPLKNENTNYSDLPYISRAEDIENRLMTDQYYALRYEARKVKQLVTLMRKFEHKRSQSNIENLMSEPDITKEEGFDVSTLLPPDTTREEYIRKMGHFSVIAPTASPIDLTNPESCFKQYSRKYMDKAEFNQSVSKSLIEPDRYNRFAHVYSFKPSEDSSKTYSELGKEDMIVDQNVKLQQIRKKLKQARPLMNVQFTSHIISRAPFKTIDDLNEEEKAQIEIDSEAKSHSRMLSSPAMLGNKHSKRWLLYDLNPPRQQPKEFYLNVLDKGSNFILPTIESRASEGFSLTEQENRKIRSVLSNKPSKYVLPRFSRAEQLKRGVQSGMIKPARIKPSINSPAPVTSLAHHQKGSLLSLNLRDNSLPVVSETRKERKSSLRVVKRKETRFPPLSHRQQFTEDPEITSLLNKL